MSEFKREGRYIVVKPDCEDSIRTERLRNYIDEMCFNTPDCVVVEADWPEYEPVWRMIERRVMGLPDEITAAQSELAALREELAKAKKETIYKHAALEAKARALKAAEQRNSELAKCLEDVCNTLYCESIEGANALDRARLALKPVGTMSAYDALMSDEFLESLKPTESGASE